MSPMRTRVLRSAALVTLVVGLGAAPAAAHPPTPVTPESWTAGERLLVSDSATGDIVVLDDGRLVTRVSTPKAPISLARSADGTTAVAMRGRDTDRATATFLRTSFDEKTGRAGLPFVARTWVGQAPGGVHHGRLPEFDGQLHFVDERTAQLHGVRLDKLVGLARAQSRTIDLGRPDHYSFVTTRNGTKAPVLHVGYLRKGEIRSLDARTGRTLSVATGCPGLHGASPDESGRRVVFACRDGLLTIPADPGAGAGRAAQRTAYPSTERIGSLVPGAGGIRWGSTEGPGAALHRVDTSGKAVTVSLLPLAHGGQARHALRTATTPDGSRLLVLTYEGHLQIRDGRTGALRSEVRVAPRTPVTAEETTAVAANPDIVATTEKAFLSVPSRGEIVEVDLASGTVGDRMPVGGTPTRMVLLHAPTAGSHGHGDHDNGDHKNGDHDNGGQAHKPGGGHPHGTATPPATAGRSTGPATPATPGAITGHDGHRH